MRGWVGEEWSRHRGGVVAQEEWCEGERELRPSRRTIGGTARGVASETKGDEQPAKFSRRREQVRITADHHCVVRDAASSWLAPRPLRPVHLRSCARQNSCFAGSGNHAPPGVVRRHASGVISGITVRGKSSSGGAERCGAGGHPVRRPRARQQSSRRGRARRSRSPICKCGAWWPST